MPFSLAGLFGTLLGGVPVAGGALKQVSDELTSSWGWQQEEQQEPWENDQPYEDEGQEWNP